MYSVSCLAGLLSGTLYRRWLAVLKPAFSSSAVGTALYLQNLHIFQLAQFAKIVLDSEQGGHWVLVSLYI